MAASYALTFAMFALAAFMRVSAYDVETMLRRGSIYENMSNGAKNEQVTEIKGFTIFETTVSATNLGDTSSCPVKPWSDAQTAARVRVVNVDFPVEFDEPPVAFVTVTKLDADKGYNLRYSANVISVDTTKAQVELSVWCNTYVFTIEVHFLAVGNA